MSQPFADALSWVPKSRTLATTLSRAQDFARAHGHASVGLEHLLLSLIEDPDASNVLTASTVELEGLSADVAAHLATLPSEDGALPVADDALLRILEYAVAAAQQSKRREVNGGIVLAAIVGEGNSEAAGILRNHGLTFAAAIEAIRGSSKPTAPAAAAGGGAPGPSLPRPVPRSPRLEEINEAATETTEAILARARRRVDSQIKPAMPGKPPPLPASPADPASGDRPALAADKAPTAKSKAAAGDGGKPAAHEPLPAEATSGPPPLPSHPPPLPADAPGSASTWLPPSPSGASGAIPGHVPSRGPPPMPPLEPRHQNGADTSGPHSLGGDAYIGSDRRPPGGEVPWPDASGEASFGGPPLRTGAPGRRSLTADLEQVAASIARNSETRGRKSRHPQAFEARDGRLARPFTLDQAATTVPTRMRVAVADAVQVRIPLVQLAALGGAPSAGKAVTLRIFAADGAAHIESTSPETYWLDAGPAGMDEDDASWSWTITPRRRGRMTLHLVALVRHFSRAGAGSEIELPEQVVTVRVARNYKSIVGWFLTVGIAAAVGSFFDDIAQPVMQAAVTWLRHTMGLP